jgi:hypothetical protein
MNKLLVFFGVLLCVTCHAQIQFDKGYFIDNAGGTVVCLIRNTGWINNPTTFEYRMNETSETLKSSLRDVQEFGISSTVKYKRFNVKIDRSSSQPEKLSSKRAPDLMEETLFLKVLVEGKGSLYQFTDGALSRFFYSIDGVEPLPLVYKVYRAENGQATNKDYKQQLLNELKCADLTEADARKAAYSAAALIRYFKAYNTCVQSPVKVFGENEDKAIFNLTLRPGVVFSSLYISNDLASIEDMDFGNNTSFRVGVEAELILPFNGNKWSVVVEPTYQQFKSDSHSSRYSDFEYSSIELPFGARRYFFLGKDAKMFINAQVLLDIPIHTSFALVPVGDLDVKGNFSAVAGMGLTIKNRFSIESRYQFNRQLFNGASFLDTRFQGIAIIVGYTF